MPNSVGRPAYHVHDDASGGSELDIRPAGGVSPYLRVRMSVESEGNVDQVVAYLTVEDEAELLKYLSRRAVERHRAHVSEILTKINNDPWGASE